jgi:protein-export membrane protein SecD
VRYVVVSVLAVLAVLVAAYAVTAFLTRDQWVGTAERAGTEVTFTATTPDGSSPTPDELATTRKVLRDRISGLGVTDAAVAATGNTLTVTVPGNGDDVGGLAGPGGALYLRPVVHVIPAQSTPSGSGGSVVPPTPAPDDAQRIADEKALRQSADQSIQILALQFQATRCGNEDVLSGRDDPNLPLVTCSADGKEVYLLEKSIISGDQVANATSGRDEQRRVYVVNVEFDQDATKDFARFTDANVGTQLAYTLNTRVISAPQIQESISDGRVVITGNFTNDQSREFATTLRNGALPLTLTVETTKPATVHVNTASTPVRLGLAAAGLLLVFAVAGAVGYLVATRRKVHAP